MTYVIKDGNCSNIFGFEAEIDESFNAPTDLSITKKGIIREINVDEIILWTEERMVLRNSNYTMYLKKK